MAAVAAMAAVAVARPRVVRVERDPRGARVGELAREVHEALGPGLAPEAYSRALSAQLQAAGLLYQKDVWVEARFRGASVGRWRLDFVLEAAVVEILAEPRIDKSDVARLRSKLRAAGLERGVVLNFGAESLQRREVRV